VARTTIQDNESANLRLFINGLTCSASSPGPAGIAGTLYDQWADQSELL